MQHKKTEIFEMIEDCIKEYKLNNGGATPSTYMIAQNVGIAQSTVSKYLKAMRQKGIMTTFCLEDINWQLASSLTKIGETASFSWLPENAPDTCKV